jgi:hypothetical protein
MLKNSEKARVAEKLGLMFKAFPASRIDPEATVLFVESVASFSLPAVLESIQRFQDGEDRTDRNREYAPSVPVFRRETKAIQERMDIVAFWENTTFIEADSPEWRAICKQMGRSMPIIERDGKSGWYLAKDEIEKLAPALVESERALLEHRDARPIPLPAMRRM